MRGKSTWKTIYLTMLRTSNASSYNIKSRPLDIDLRKAPKFDVER
ncbi:hypothetical protein SLEP1_g22254 [Rubroshorea leprosula]|uniref:Uncharacterized protein n=1 Tax=Rubroshorea leprosula TaxID=152421 RepID=A0AAV5J8M2_9ROSI|nr:hypothetical protein SLEP1_g22254 [Rubroshorea leprosula]